MKLYRCLLLCLLIFTLCIQHSLQYSVARTWPKDWTAATEWTGYGIYFGLVVIFPILLILVIYIVVFVIWILRRCTICGCPLGLLGGANPKSNGYNRTTVLITKAVFYIFCAAAV
jgi:hypothetical protein